MAMSFAGKIQLYSRQRSPSLRVLSSQAFSDSPGGGSSRCSKDLRQDDGLVLMARFLLNPFDEAERAIKEPGYWIVASVVPQISWPLRKQIIEYEGKEFVLFPQSEEESAGVAIRSDKYGLEGNEARKQIMSFCSALSWAEGGGIEIVSWGGGNVPRPIRVRRGRSVVDFLQVDHLPHVETDEDRAALALYREGLSLENPFYSFLSLFKAISVVLPSGPERAKWIESALDELDDHRAKERRDELLKDDVDIGQYIWDEGRNAIAHAERKPFVNPDEVEDHLRLQQDIPLLRNLAELAIEERTGIRRSHTIWREHLYEVQGFREIIPDDILELLENSEAVPAGTTIELPERYTVLARRGVAVHAFENMVPEIFSQVEGGIALDFVSDDEAVRIRTVLDFSNERLHFDAVRGIGFSQNRDDRKYVNYEIAVLNFQRCILSNGHLEIWDQEPEKMLGRSETCIPVNCFVNEEFYTKELESLQRLLDE